MTIHEYSLISKVSGPKLDQKFWGIVNNIRGCVFCIFYGGFEAVVFGGFEFAILSWTYLSPLAAMFPLFFCSYPSFCSYHDQVIEFEMLCPVSKVKLPRFSKNS